MVVGHYLKLQSRTDAFSYQVSAEDDRRFWFRLERESEQDVITDFFLGSVPQERAAGALISCYRHLGLTPKKILVFRDILPSSDSEDGPADIARALDEAQHLYAICGKALLSRCGATKVKDRLKRRLGKYDLVVQADAGVGWTMVD